MDTSTIIKILVAIAVAYFVYQWTSEMFVDFDMSHTEMGLGASKKDFGLFKGPVVHKVSTRVKPLPTKPFASA
jgi:hypothetical protein